MKKFKLLGSLLSLGMLASLGLAQAWADNETTTIPLKSVEIMKGHYKVGIMVSVAGGPPSMLTFDTGGVGLHIFKSQVGNMNITYTNQRVYSTFYDSLGGFEIDGVIAYAPVTIGGITTKPIPILVVDHAKCFNNSKCAVADLQKGGPLMFGKFWGELGTGMRMEGDDKGPIKLRTPFVALPGNYSSGFIVENLSPTHDGVLQIGLTPSNTKGFSKIQLPVRNQLADGTKIYDDKSLLVSYSINGVKNKYITTFDCGEDNQVNYLTGPISALPMQDQVWVKAGYPFEAILAQGFDWKFITSTRAGMNAVAVLPPIHPSRLIVNTGIPFFYHYDMMYDFKKGQLGFKLQN